MVETALLPAIKTALQRNECGDASPYCLSFACVGRSGASFGMFQGDTSVNPVARDTLRRALQASGVAEDAGGRILAAVGLPCPGGDPLSAADAAAANAALDSAAGRALVDAMDDTLLQAVLERVDACIAAAATRRMTLQPIVVVYVALWANMSGEPTTLEQWLAGRTQMTVAPPAGPQVLQQDIERYLRATGFFRQHPRNFAHLQDSVAAGMEMLAVS